MARGHGGGQLDQRRAAPDRHGARWTCLTIDDFQAVSDRVPFLADLKPSGKYVQEDLHRAGSPAVMKYLLEQGIPARRLPHRHRPHLAENLADLPGFTPGQDVFHFLDNPIKKTGHIQILKGNLAPGGAVAKITGKEGDSFTGTAKVYDSEEEMLHALERKEIDKGHVVVIRYEGPKGGPGMPEMLTPTSAIMGAGLGKDVALITDGRFSGGSHGFITGHHPEAQEAANLVRTATGSRSTPSETITVHRDESPRAGGPPPTRPQRRCTSTSKTSTASHGCVTDEREIHACSSLSRGENCFFHRLSGLLPGRYSAVRWALHLCRW